MPESTYAQTQPDVNSKELRRKFIGCARRVRRISENFIPDLFASRRFESGAPDRKAMEALLRSNASGVKLLRNTFEKIRSEGVLSHRHLSLYEARCDREDRLLQSGTTFFDAWCKAGNADDVRTALAANDVQKPKANDLQAKLTCVGCYIASIFLVFEDMIAA